MNYIVKPDEIFMDNAEYDLPNCPNFACSEPDVL